MARISKQTPEKSFPEISVLVPVMNEQGNIRPLIDEIAAVYTGRPFEIIYVNDASTDGTSADLTDAQKHIPQLRVCITSIVPGNRLRCVPPCLQQKPR